MADITEIIPKKAITSITTTDTAITKLDESTLKFITTVSALSEALKKGGISYKDINKAQKETVTTKTQLTKLEKEQLSAEKALQKQRDKGLAQIAKLEQKEKDLQAAINKEVKSEQDLINKTNALVVVRKRLDTSTVKGAAEHKKLTTEINKNTVSLKNQDAQINRNQRNVGNYSEGITNALSQLGLMPPVLGKVTAGMTGVSAAAGTGTKAMKLLRVAVISTGIGALVIAVMALVTWFKNTVAGGEALVKILAPIKAIVQVLINRFAQLGESVALLFSGDVTGAIETFKGSLTGVNDELKKQIALQQILAGLEIRIKKDVGDLAIAKQQLTNSIAASRLAARDENLTLEQQIQAQKDAIKYTKELAVVKADDLKRQIALMVANEQAGISNQDEINERKQLIAQLLAIEGERDKGLLRLVEYEKTLKNKLIKQEKDVTKAKQKEFDDRLKAKEKAIEEDLKLEQDFNDSIDTMQDTFMEGVDEQAQKELDATAKLIKDKQALEAEALQKKHDDEKDLAEKINELKNQLLTEGINAAFSIYQSSLERDSQALQIDRENELVKAGEDKEAQKKVNDKYDKLEAAVKTKQAKTEKLQALFSIGLSTAMAIAKSIATVPLPVGLPLVILNAALGAVQLAVAIAKPIPKFFKGTDSAPSGVISVGEKGGELIHKKTGEMLYAPEQTYMSGMQGAKIYTNQETERIFNGSGSDSLEIKELTKINKRVASALENQTHYHFQTDRIIKSKGNYRRTWLNTKLAR